MLVEIIITDDNSEVTAKKIDLDQWKGMLPELKLLSIVLNRSLAATYVVCVTVGIDVLIQEYARVNLRQRKAELRLLIEGG